MSNTEPKCVLHLSGKASEELKTFDDYSWQKVKDADKKRRSWLNSSKSLQLQLPDDYDSTVCYHTKCYKYFTAVPKPSTNSENQGLKQRLLRVNVEHSTTSSSGVYEPKCIFCNKVTKSSGKDKREYLGSLEVESSEVKIKEAAVKLQDNVLLAKISGQDLNAKEVIFATTRGRIKPGKHLWLEES